MVFKRKALQWLFDKIVPPLVLGTGGTMIITSIKKGSWLTYFKNIPVSAKVCIYVLIGLWLLYKVVKAIRARINAYNKPHALLFATIPAHGLTKIDEMEYLGVIWHVSIPSPSPFNWDRGISIDRITIRDIRINTPPRCPICGTEVEEKKKLIGFIWECFGCGFSIKSRDSIYTISERVKKLARRELEREKEQRGNQNPETYFRDY